MENSAITRVLVPQLEALHHEEADTRMVFHAYHTAIRATQPVKILVRADDGDVFLSFLFHAKNLGNTQVYQDLGLCSKNNRRTINLSSLAEILGSEVGIINCI